MFTKTKYKLKNKLRKWLGIEKLEKDYAYYKSHTDSNIHNIDERLTFTDNKRLEQIDALNRTLKSAISLASDVTPNKYNNNKSWAVICIEGKHNVVKFIDMQGQDYRYILDFLKQFECSRRVVDAPCLQMFEDYFVDFRK